MSVAEWALAVSVFAVAVSLGAVYYAAKARRAAVRAARQAATDAEWADQTAEPHVERRCAAAQPQLVANPGVSITLPSCQKPAGHDGHHRAGQTTWGPK